jgi:hypothetical protein
MAKSEAHLFIVHDADAYAAAGSPDLDTAVEPKFVQHKLGETATAALHAGTIHAVPLEVADDFSHLQQAA